MLYTKINRFFSISEPPPLVSEASPLSTAYQSRQTCDIQTLASLVWDNLNFYFMTDSLNTKLTSASKFSSVRLVLYVQLAFT